MSDHLPLDGLSEAQKDALIRNLWDDLRSERARVHELAQRLAQLEGAPADSPLLTQLRERGTRKSAGAPSS